MKRLLIPVMLIILVASCKPTKWPDADRKEFLKTCSEAAVKGGMPDSKASSYCDCMQKKLEAKYPNVKDAGKVNQQELQSEAWIKEVQDCLK